MYVESATGSSASSPPSNDDDPSSHHLCSLADQLGLRAVTHSLFSSVTTAASYMAYVMTHLNHHSCRGYHENTATGTGDAPVCHANYSECARARARPALANARALQQGIRRTAHSASRCSSHPRPPGSPANARSHTSHTWCAVNHILGSASFRGDGVTAISVAHHSKRATVVYAPGPTHPLYTVRKLRDGPGHAGQHDRDAVVRVAAVMPSGLLLLRVFIEANPRLSSFVDGAAVSCVPSGEHHRITYCVPRKHAQHASTFVAPTPRDVTDVDTPRHAHLCFSDAATRTTRPLRPTTI